MTLGWEDRHWPDLPGVPHNYVNGKWSLGYQPPHWDTTVRVLARASQGQPTPGSSQGPASVFQSHSQPEHSETLAPPDNSDLYEDPPRPASAETSHGHYPPRSSYHNPPSYTPGSVRSSHSQHPGGIHPGQQGQKRHGEGGHAPRSGPPDRQSYQTNALPPHITHPGGGGYGNEPEDIIRQETQRRQDKQGRVERDRWMSGAVTEHSNLPVAVGRHLPDPRHHIASTSSNLENVGSSSFNYPLGSNNPASHTGATRMHPGTMPPPPSSRAQGLGATPGQVRLHGELTSGGPTQGGRTQGEQSQGGQTHGAQNQGGQIPTKPFTGAGGHHIARSELDEVTFPPSPFKIDTLVATLEAAKVSSNHAEVAPSKGVQKPGPNSSSGASSARATPQKTSTKSSGSTGGNNATSTTQAAEKASV
jgi:hypothetical protein